MKGISWLIAVLAFVCIGLLVFGISSLFSGLGFSKREKD
jgi:hypothetical protein